MPESGSHRVLQACRNHLRYYFLWYLRGESTFKHVDLRHFTPNFQHSWHAFSPIDIISFVIFFFSKCIELFLPSQEWQRPLEIRTSLRESPRISDLTCHNAKRRSNHSNLENSYRKLTIFDESCANDIPNNCVRSRRGKRISIFTGINHQRIIKEISLGLETNIC